MSSSDDHTYTSPTTPPAPWLGGKSKLAPKIIDRLEAIDHITYAEPFVGMGGVFFRRRFIPRAEVINDYNGEITNFFQIIQQHYPYLMNDLKFVITTRSMFEKLRETNPDTLTDLQRAARFLYLQKLSFGGRVRGPTFGVDPTRSGKFNIIEMADDLEALHERLAGVTIENLSYDKFIERYDKAGTLFYLDPPYYGGEDDYGKDMFSREDFQSLADQLRGIEGAFFLSINDVLEIREIFAGFNIEAVALKYSIAKTQQTEASELFISNREIKVSQETLL